MSACKLHTVNLKRVVQRTKSQAVSIDQVTQYKWTEYKPKALEITKPSIIPYSDLSSMTSAWSWRQGSLCSCFTFSAVARELCAFLSCSTVLLNKVLYSENK